MRCPYCAGLNHAGANFCIECGEPLDALSLAAAPPRGTPNVREEGFNFRLPYSAVRIHLGLEIVVGIILLALVLGWDALSTAQQARHDAQAAAWRRGLIAEDARRWTEAIADYQAAGDFEDAPQRLHAIQDAYNHLPDLYQAAEAERAAGAWWAATVDYSAVAAFQPDYPNVTARLAEARAAAPPVLYRQPGAAHSPTLWWAAADGSKPHAIPGTGPDSFVNGLSPDGHWAVYSDYVVSARSSTRVFRLLDLHTGTIRPLLFPSNAQAIGLKIEFRADSSGFWAREADQTFYADLTQEAPGGVALQPCAPGIAASNPASGNTILLTIAQSNLPGNGTPPPLRGTTNLLGGDLLGPYPGTWLLQAGPLGQSPIALQWEPGTVVDPTFSPNGRFLSYRVLTPGPNGPASNTLVQPQSDTLVVLDLQAARAPEGGLVPAARQELLHVALTYDGPPQPPLQAQFIPGAEARYSRLLVTPPAGVPWIYDPATSAQTPLQTDAASEGWRLAPSSLAASPDGHWLGLQVWSLSAQGARTKIVLQPADGRPSWSVEVPSERVTWLGFSSDESYAFYAINHPDGTGIQHGILSSVPMPRAGPDIGAAAIHALVDYRIPSTDWIQNTTLSPDGRLVLALITANMSSAVPNDVHHAPGLYALHPNGTGWRAIAPGATAFWVPGDYGWSVAVAP